MVSLSYTKTFKNSCCDILPDGGAGDFAHGFHGGFHICQHGVGSQTQLQRVPGRAHGFAGTAAGVKLPGVGEDGTVAGGFAAEQLVDHIRELRSCESRS